MSKEPAEKMKGAPAAIPEVQVPDFKVDRKPERSWHRCPECKLNVFREANGKEYYHGQACSKNLTQTKPKTKKGKP